MNRNGHPKVEVIEHRVRPAPILGLSALVFVVGHLARRLQIEERLSSQTAKRSTRGLDPTAPER